MNYRTTEILDEKSLTTTGTEIIPINVKDIISRIAMSWRTVRVAGSMSSYTHKDITKIELVDGSDVLHSLDGGQNAALCIYDRKIGSMSTGEHMYACDTFSLFGIDFGRYLYDPELAFDPTKFNNPQLKVTYDVDVSDTSNETGYLEVWAECFDEKVVSPVGFLMAKELYSRTPPSSGYWHVDLPTDYPVRKLLVQGYYKAYEPWSVVAEARLDEDNGKRIPFDWVLEDYYRMRMGIDRPVEEQIDGHATVAGITYYVTPTSYWTSGIVMETRTEADVFQMQPGKGGYLVFQCDAEPTEIHGRVIGWLPNHCFQFPFGFQEDMADWYDVTRLGSLRLRLKAGAEGAAGTVAIVLQQLRRY